MRNVLHKDEWRPGHWLWRHSEELATRWHCGTLIQFIFVPGSCCSTRCWQERITHNFLSFHSSIAVSCVKYSRKLLLFLILSVIEPCAINSSLAPDLKQQQGGDYCFLHSSPPPTIVAHLVVTDTDQPKSQATTQSFSSISFTTVFTINSNGKLNCTKPQSNQLKFNWVVISCIQRNAKTLSCQTASTRLSES